MQDVHPITLFEPHMLQADEKTLLLVHLKRVQQDLLWKLDGLSDDDLRRPMTKTGTNLIGLVKHLAGVTAEYLCSPTRCGTPAMPTSSARPSTAGSG